MKLQSSIKITSEYVLNVEYLPRTSSVVVSSTDNRIRMVDLPSQRIQWETAASTQSEYVVRDSCVTQSGVWVCSSLNGAELGYIDARTGRLEITLHCMQLSRFLLLFLIM
jgi:hypothetical protein